MHKILVIDDDEKYLNSLHDMLSLKYDVIKTTSAKDGINFCRESKFDLIIVDLYMDEMSGIVFSELVQDLFPPQKIIILSGTANVDDQLEVLDKDVVDYMDKSIAPEVFMKRIEKILKSTENTNKLYSKNENIVLDRSNRFVYVNDEKVHLPNKEFNLLTYFLLNKNKVLDREEMYEFVWGEPLYLTNLRIVDLHVLKLRKKLNLKCVHSERGVGYIWEE